MSFLDMSITILAVFSTVLMLIPVLYEPVIGLIQLFKDLWKDIRENRKEEGILISLWLYATTTSFILLVIIVIIKIIVVLKDGIFK